MQIHIEGQHTDIQPTLHDWITERFEELNTPHDDILHARMVLNKATHHIQGADEARVILSLAGKTLSASKRVLESEGAENRVKRQQQTAQ